MRLLAGLLALTVLAPYAAAADIPGMADSATDGIPFANESPALLAAMREVQESISGQRIHDCIQAITTEGATNYRVMGTPTHDMFLQNHKDEFTKLGLASAMQPFKNGSVGLGGPAQSPVQGGTNLVSVLPGKNLTKWIVLGGHYDTREETVGGGALDDTSGMCTVTELARDYKAFADKHGPLEATVIFNWYDGEEWGLYGSIAFAEDPSIAKKLLNLTAQTPIEVIVSQSYDMAGLNYPAKNTWVQYGDATKTDKLAVLNLRTAPVHAEENWTCWSYGCYEKLKQRDDFAKILDRNARYQTLVREVAYDLLQLPREYVWVYDDHYGRSDHIPLIALGSAGQRIQGSHDEEYPHYHHATDTLEGLYVLAGSKELLIQGFQTEAQAGGLSAFYVALTGGVGKDPAPPKLVEKATTLMSPIQRTAIASNASVDGAPAKSRGIPAPALVVVIGAAALVAVVARRRRI